MTQHAFHPDFQQVYYFLYLGLCTPLIVLLAVALHRAGNVFLQDSFPGRPELVRSVRGLLDIGFYLVCFGYVALTFQTRMQFSAAGDLIEILSWKVGSFLLLLGFMHFFNLLLLSIFRRRGPVVAAPAS